MFKKIIKSKLVGNTVIYSLANMLNGAIPFLLLPILTRVFSPEEYGLVTLIGAIMAIMGAFIGLSVHGAVSIKYFDKVVNHPQFVGAGLLVITGSTSLVLLFLVFVGDVLSDWINLPKKWLFLAAIASAAQFFINIRLVLWQVKDQPIRYGVFQISQTIFNLALSLALVFWATWGWQGRVWGIVLALLFFSVISLISMQKNFLVTFKKNTTYIKSILNFGIPLIPHTLGGLAIAMSDRFILNSVMDVKSVGIYSVGMQMGMVIGILADAFSKAYGPYLFKLLVDKNLDLSKLVLNTYYIFFVFSITTLVYIAFLKQIYDIFIGESFRSSMGVAVLISIGYIFTSMYYALSNILFFKEKTGFISMLTFTCGIFSLITTYLLVVKMGILGAAWSFLITQIIFFSGTVLLIQKFYPLPWLNFSGKKYPNQN